MILQRNGEGHDDYIGRLRSILNDTVIESERQ